MTTVTSQEIALFRSQLADYPSAMEALDLIEDCDGDLEDAAMTLAIRVGQEPGMTNSEWLDAMARRWRVVICEQGYRSDLLNNSLVGMMAHLQSMPAFPQPLATPILIYVLKQGVNGFCEPLDALKSSEC
ncbi:hypothetical protein [Nostoc sp. CCY0012]|uniref:hypothetical protein n=1 Tax=Nostoc sp. CCY0012 TaxID=1056123 RepID=UPI0039C73CBB